MELRLKHHINEIITLTDDELNEIFTFFSKKKYKKHQYIVQEGDLKAYEHFILKGIVKSSYTDNEGKEHIMQLAAENWWFSDTNAFNNGTVTTMNIDCLENTETLFISYENKEALCEKFRKMEYFFRKKYTTGNIALHKRVLSLLSNDAAERYSQFLNQYPLIHQRVPKALVAAYLGVSRETLSRLSPKI
ncbi:CRP-like cAMP-binding protein [Pedobacter cryoconitis]|uniref:Crp/Fnr family transcriptional regulator n=1 Tax=Pedobacter cryoconitis TaxID=188932 RepID=UPI00160B559F|nr:Crp/Fnr family transcriptional regulator [Pedobacter cryoconitis]MBB6273890.1 CRP-like cAMP-binding protein [Pedobacter cryoconitis]